MRKLSPSRACYGCRKAAPEVEFTKSDQYCRGCRRELTRRYAKEHPEKIKAAISRWQKRNRARLREYDRAWRAANPDKIAVRNRTWRKKHAKEYAEKNRARLRENARRQNAKRQRENPEKVRAWRRASHARNRESIAAKNTAARLADPEKFRALDRARYVRDRERRISQAHKMRAKRARAPGTHTAEEWAAVLGRFKHCCAYCGIALTKENVSRDHVIPLSKGGRNDIANIVPACRPCNNKKRAKLLITG